ncbi:MAG: hypothetical protein EXQ83_09170 [Xanthobacteraceae bacterium]|nr:hypothetical protein [Xanthobacteraceae bacterium]
MLYDLPIVTMAGDLMRGRHSAAFLSIMDVPETLAATMDDYVSVAVRLARDAAWRSTIEAKMAAKKHRLYRDRAPVAALEDFLDRVAREHRSP